MAVPNHFRSKTDLPLLILFLVRRHLQSW